MKFLNHLLAMSLLVGLSACSSDDPVPAPGTDGTDPASNGFYSKVTLKLPIARSESAEGTEVGKDYENKVGSILVVLAKENDSNGYDFITYALSDVPNLDGDTHTVVFENKTKLFAEAEHEVCVFAYCNPTPELIAKVKALDAEGAIEKSFTDLICDSNLQATWTPNGFLMTSVAVLKTNLETKDQLKNNHNTPATAFDLGTIQVIRAVSRFDFRDYTKNNCTYKIYDPDFVPANEGDQPTDENLIATVKLVNVAMVNRRDEFYYLPRTTTGGLCPGKDGMETPYVVTPTTATYSLVNPTEALAHKDAQYNGLAFESLAGVLGKAEDIDHGASGVEDKWGSVTIKTDADREGYHIWRYTTENVFAEGVVPDPSKTTGYIFEAEVTPNKDFKRAGDTKTIGEKVGYKDGDDMYIFNNRLYLNAKHMYLAVQDQPSSKLAEAFAALFDVAGTGDAAVVTVKEGVNDAAFAAQNVVVYKAYKGAESDADNGKYYCFYFAYNVHNDDKQPSEYGPMEYATVRNNVYKLQVTSIKGFGTFVPSSNVEDWDVYFKLSVEIRPWVVRVNNIEF